MYKQLTPQQYDNLRGAVITQIERDIKDDHYIEIYELLTNIPIQEQLNYIDDDLSKEFSSSLKPTHINNPHQFNYTQQLEHRLKMVQDDLNILRQFIYANNLNKIFEGKSTLSGDEANCNLLNIEIACDLSNDESLSWGMFK